jgi:hypothetical protein
MADNPDSFVNSSRVKATRPNPIRASTKASAGPIKRVSRERFDFFNVSVSQRLTLRCANAINPAK